MIPEALVVVSLALAEKALKRDEERGDGGQFFTKQAKVALPTADGGPAAFTHSLMQGRLPRPQEHLGTVWVGCG